MTLTFSSKAWDNDLYWQKTDNAILKRMNALITDIQCDPFEGRRYGKPIKGTLPFVVSMIWGRCLTSYFLQNPSRAYYVTFGGQWPPYHVCLVFPAMDKAQEHGLIRFGD